MDIITLLFGIVGLIFTIVIHEVAHGYIANKLGDPTAKLSGRLTLNPIPHIDPIGTLVLPIISFLSPLRMIFGWAKPVPVDPYNLKNPKKDMLLIALAGPVSNLLIAVVLSFFLRLIPNEIIFSVTYWLIRFNVSLAIFNLIPVHPLDGGKILVGILPDYYSRQVEYFLDKFGFLLLIILIISPITSTILSPIIYFIVNLLIPTFGTI